MPKGDNPRGGRPKGSSHGYVSAFRGALRTLELEHSRKVIEEVYHVAMDRERKDQVQALGLLLKHSTPSLKSVEMTGDESLISKITVTLDPQSSA